MTASALLRSLERFLLPNACVACDRSVEDNDLDALVCSRCRWRMRAVVSGGACARCAQPLPLIGPCRFCRDFPEPLRWIRSAVWLDREPREVVHHLKYEGFRALAAFAATMIARNMPRPANGVLVPIPMSQRRERSRGYNQASLIAHALGSIWHLPVNHRMLHRARGADTQTALTPLARRSNVAGAFHAVMPSMPSLPSTPSMPWGRAGQSGDAVAVIIVDDVLTTGATIHAAAAALEWAGWRDLGAVTFARALPVERRVG